MGEFAQQMRINAAAKRNKAKVNPQEPIKKEIYEKPGKPDTPDFRKNAIARRIAKMSKNNDKEKKDAGNPRA